MPLTVTYSEGEEKDIRSIRINGCTYPIYPGSALTHMFYSVLFSGMTKCPHSGKCIPDTRHETVYYDRPETYWKVQYPEPDIDSSDEQRLEWGVLQNSFLNSERVKKWHKRRSELQTDPDRYIEDVKKHRHEYYNVPGVSVS